MRSYINFLIGHSFYDRAKFDDAMKYYKQVNDLHLTPEDAEEYMFTKGHAHLTKKEYKENINNFLNLMILILIYKYLLSKEGCHPEHREGSEYINFRYPDSSLRSE